MPYRSCFRELIIVFDDVREIFDVRTSCCSVVPATNLNKLSRVTRRRRRRYASPRVCQMKTDLTEREREKNEEDSSLTLSFLLLQEKQLFGQFSALGNDRWIMHTH